MMYPLIVRGHYTNMMTKILNEYVIYVIIILSANLSVEGIGFKSKETLEMYSPFQNGDGTQNGSSKNDTFSSSTLHTGQQLGNLFL